MVSPLIESPLILGGHTFIRQLGNEPPASEQQQRLIVETCLDLAFDGSTQHISRSG